MTPSGAAAPASSAGNPLIDVFLSPTEAMDNLARRPRFIAPLLLSTAISLALTAVGNQRGVIESTVRKKMESSPRVEQLEPEQRTRVVESAVRVSSTWSWAGGAVGPTIGALLLGGIFLGLAAATASPRPRFSQTIAVVTHAWLPMSLSQLISIPVLLARTPDTVDFQNVLSMANLSILFSPDEQRRLYQIGSSIDLFSFWVIALLTIGLARLTGKSKAVALGLVLTPWLLYVAIFKVLLG